MAVMVVFIESGEKSRDVHASKGGGEWEAKIELRSADCGLAERAEMAALSNGDAMARMARTHRREPAQLSDARMDKA
jgi:hypothetical protein